MQYYHCETSDAMVVMDAQGLVIGWPLSARRLLGHDPADILGQPISRIFTAHDLEQGVDRYELEVARRDGFAEDDRWHLRKDGSRVWVTGTLSAIRDPSGEVLGFMKVLRDRTDLRTKIERQDALVAEGERRIRSMKTFLETLGHELRNPLSVMVNALTLLNAEVTSEKTPRSLGFLQRQVDILQGLSNDLMDLARGENDGFALAWERVHLQSLVSSIVDQLEASATSTGVRMVSILQEGAIHIDADPRRLAQVLLNMIGNAIKFTPPGGNVVIKVNEEVDEAVIRVIDTGIGIAPDTMPRIFELFARGDAAKHAVPDGLGIGLHLVRNIVEAHRGTVAARSSGVDKGAAFTIRLPLRRSSSEA